MVALSCVLCLFFFFFNAPATNEIYTLSLHDALPISPTPAGPGSAPARSSIRTPSPGRSARSEEHTSVLQSPYDLVCRLLLEKKKKKIKTYSITQKTEKKQQIFVDEIST